MASDEILFRLDINFNPNNNELYIKIEDFPVMINTFVDHNFFSQELSSKMTEYITENINNFPYKILSEIAVIYASKISE